MAHRPGQRIERGISADRLWIEAPEMEARLSASESLDEAREGVLEYLSDLEDACCAGDLDLDRLEWSAVLDALHRFKRILSPENEAIAGFSTLEILWGLASDSDTEDVSVGFIDEMRHLFQTIHGRMSGHGGWFARSHAEASDALEQMPAHGRRAARARSRFLDALGDGVWMEIERFPSGLDPSMVEERKRNAERILEHLEGSANDWHDAAWQRAHVFRGNAGAQALPELVPLTGSEIASLRLASAYGVPWGITPYTLALFDATTSSRRRDAQVRAQVIPPLSTVRAMIEHRDDRNQAFDFMRERDTSPIDRVTRRYPMVAILKVCDTCPQICVYCQRNWEIADAMDLEAIPSADTLDPALDWFAEHPAITDVLLTGGDPFLLSDDALSHVIERLTAMEHIRNIRIGTRIPVTMPMRITDPLAELLGRAIRPGRRNLSVVTHVETASEVTPDLADAVWRLRRRGIAVYNQQVFTVETSRRFQSVATRIALRQAGIDPYYTFYTKGKDEHREYLVPIARVLQERKEEARLLPGIFRTDEPVFNVPGLGKNHLRAGQDRELIAIRVDGRRVYLFHPWEKGIVPVAPWPYVDVSIRDYLDRLRAMGEDPDDYASIWSYV